MRKFIYNVLIGGSSIGLTFNPREAQQWMKESHYNGSKEIVKMAYKA